MHKHYEPKFHYHYYETMNVAGSFHVNVAMECFFETGKLWTWTIIVPSPSFSRSVYQPLLPCISYYKKKGVIYWSLLHSQRWCVRDIWYFLTTLQLVCFRMRYDYHFYHRHRFRKKQQITIFFCFVETTSQFNVFLASILAR